MLEIGTKVRIKNYTPEEYNGKIGIITNIVEKSNKIYRYRELIEITTLTGKMLMTSEELEETEEIDIMWSLKLGNLAFDIENGYAVRFRRITPVPIPEWDCQADELGGNDVTCCACGMRFCPGCADKCPNCDSDKVIRDKRWDEDRRDEK